MKTKLFLTGILSFTLCLNSNAQPDSSVVPVDTFELDTPAGKTQEIYTLKPSVDIPIVAVGTGWSIYAFTRIYNKEPSTREQILSLDENDIPKIDRWAAGMSNQAADDNSDFLFYGSIAVPFMLLFDKEIRHDAGKIGFMFWESMAITGMFYTGTVYFVDRYRPETYNTTLSVEERMGGNFKDAFMAGHPALVATSMFFTAKVYSDYHPGSKFTYVLYAAAIGATGATAYLRHIAGKHFPTDLFTGVTIGTLSGILVPQFHKNKVHRDKKLGFLPYTNGKNTGFYLTYKFK